MQKRKPVKSMKRKLAKNRQQMLEAKDFVDDLDNAVFLSEEEKSLIYELITEGVT